MLPIDVCRPDTTVPSGCICVWVSMISSVGCIQLLSGHWCCGMCMMYLSAGLVAFVIPVRLVRHVRLVRVLSACAIVRTMYVCVAHIWRGFVVLIFQCIDGDDPHVCWCVNPTVWGPLGPILQFAKFCPVLLLRTQYERCHCIFYDKRGNFLYCSLTDHWSMMFETTAGCRVTCSIGSAKTLSVERSYLAFLQNRIHTTRYLLSD